MQLSTHLTPKRVAVAGLLTAVAGGVLVTTASASVPATDGSYYGCFDAKHVVTILDYPRTRCPKGSVMIHWNIKGAQGPAGAKGATGATGAVGPVGAQGPKGDTGAQGPKGDTGAAGATGADGAQGPKGDTGATGAAGATGADGAQGPKGDTGATGPAGADGAQGPKGDTGAQGPKGDTGPQGLPGSIAASRQVVTASGTGSATATCPTGFSAIGGGATITTAANAGQLRANDLSGDSAWSASSNKPTDTITVHVVCAS